MSEKYYTPQEVAEKLQVAVKTVYRWINEGDLNAVRLGRGNAKLRIPQEALDRFVQPVHADRYERTSR